VRAIARCCTGSDSKRLGGAGVIDWTIVAEAIGQASGRRVDPRTPHAVGGGCTNEAYRLDDEAQGYFVKLNNRDRLAMFEAEAAGLEEMADTETIRVPRPPLHEYDRRAVLPCHGIHPARRAHSGWPRRGGASACRHAPCLPPRLRLGPRQHHRFHAPTEPPRAGLGRVLEPAPARVPARPGRPQRIWLPASGAGRATARRLTRPARALPRPLFAPRRPVGR